MSQTFEANDNQFMRNMLAGGTLGSYTTVTANAVALTPTSRLTIDSDVGYNIGDQEPRGFLKRNPIEWASMPTM
jgi:hypothetical protein